jgi:DNA-binding XRE family transcriptional regulator
MPSRRRRRRRRSMLSRSRGNARRVDVMGVPLKSIAKRWMKEPGFKKGYDALEEEFSLASQLIKARSRAGLTQAEVAERMGTSQSSIARLESGAAKPSLSTLRRYAKATGTIVRIKLEPAERTAEEGTPQGGVGVSMARRCRSRRSPRGWVRPRRS